MYLSIRVSDDRFKLRTLLYTLYYTHLHINMMLMQCFSKRLYGITSRVLQTPPPGQSELGRLVNNGSYLSGVSHLLGAHVFRLTWS